VYDRRNALFDSLGIAAGNAATIVPFVMVCCLPLIYMYMQTTGRTPPKEEYTNEEVGASMLESAACISYVSYLMMYLHICDCLCYIFASVDSWRLLPELLLL
jgi:hypothetical protein